MWPFTDVLKTLNFIKYKEYETILNFINYKKYTIKN